MAENMNNFADDATNQASNIATDATNQASDMANDIANQATGMITDVANQATDLANNFSQALKGLSASLPIPQFRKPQKIKIEKPPLPRKLQKDKKRA